MIVIQFVITDAFRVRLFYGIKSIISDKPCAFYITSFKGKE